MERRKAIVVRMRDLLARAAAAQAAHCRIRRSTVATTARKWKRAVGRIQKRGDCNGEDGHAREEEDHGALLASASSSSISSCCRDATAAADAEACCSSTAVSCPWPALVPSAAAPATLRLSSCGSGSWSSDENDDVRMANWVTTDSDFVVLEL